MSCKARATLARPLIGPFPLLAALGLAFVTGALEELRDSDGIHRYRWHGRGRRRNLRREFLSVDELLAQLREHGIEDVSQVRAAYLESDGVVSVIPLGRSSSEPPRRRSRGAPGG